MVIMTHPAEVLGLLFVQEGVGWVCTQRSGHTEVSRICKRNQVITQVFRKEQDQQAADLYLQKSFDSCQTGYRRKQHQINALFTTVYQLMQLASWHSKKNNRINTSVGKAKSRWVRAQGDNWENRLSGVNNMTKQRWQAQSGSWKFSTKCQEVSLRTVRLSRKLNIRRGGAPVRRRLFHGS